MKTSSLLDHIAIDPNVLLGKPVIRGTGVTVEQIMKMIRKGETIEEILAGHPNLTREDVLACVVYALKK